MALVIGTIGPGPSYAAQIVPSLDSELATAHRALLPANVRVFCYNIDGPDRDVLTIAIDKLRGESDVGEV